MSYMHVQSERPKRATCTAACPDTNGRYEGKNVYRPILYVQYDGLNLNQYRELARPGLYCAHVFVHGLSVNVLVTSL